MVIKDYPVISKKELKPPEEYAYYCRFKAPDKPPRDIVMDYMVKMATTKWTPSHTWTINWKEQGHFPVNLTYEKGKTYYGIPYSSTKAPYCEFIEFVKDGVFTPNSPYYEEIVGNHCSSSMFMSFQQVYDMFYMNYPCDLRPTSYRVGKLKFPDGIKAPPSRSKDITEDWVSATAFAHNSKSAMMNGYASLGKGDILIKDINNSGHTRMVRSVETVRNEDGTIDTANSYVYVIEQTNAWFDENKNSTWWIDKQYSFDKLYQTQFMPVTLCIYHEKAPVIEDAVIAMTEKNTPESIVNELKGSIQTNFPLSFISVKITDENGEIKGSSFIYNLFSVYDLPLYELHDELGINRLDSGKYRYTLTAGIARGSVVLEDFEFIK